MELKDINLGLLFVGLILILVSLYRFIFEDSESTKFFGGGAVLIVAIVLFIIPAFIMKKKK